MFELFLELPYSDLQGERLFQTCPRVCQTGAKGLLGPDK